jgi:hypothetical protein
VDRFEGVDEISTSPIYIKKGYFEKLKICPSFSHFEKCIEITLRRSKEQLERRPYHLPFHRNSKLRKWTKIRLHRSKEDLEKRLTDPRIIDRSLQNFFFFFFTISLPLTSTFPRGFLVILLVVAKPSHGGSVQGLSRGYVRFV